MNTTIIILRCVPGSPLISRAKEMLSDPNSLAIVKCHFPTSCDVSSRSVIFSVRWGGEPKSVTSLVKKRKKKEKKT